jgi:DNA-directed RNA polymerase subunit RPC12/RpoP
MVQHQSHVTSASAKKSETQGADVRCPSCGHINALDHCTTVAVPKAYAFPAECVVLAAMECEHCGCVSFFNPRVSQRPPSPNSRLQ